MDMILVVCGAGASSTFLASRMRALATERGLDLTARAASHLESAFGELEAEAAEYSVPAALLPSTAFGPEGATDALDQALALLATTTKGTSHA
jgi:PTS system cellobiose-specific IIB component